MNPTTPIRTNNHNTQRGGESSTSRQPVRSVPISQTPSDETQLSGLEDFFTAAGDAVRSLLGYEITHTTSLEGEFALPSEEQTPENAEFIRSMISSEDDDLSLGTSHSLQTDFATKAIRSQLRLWQGQGCPNTFAPAHVLTLFLAIIAGLEKPEDQRAALDKLGLEDIDLAELDIIAQQLSQNTDGVTGIFSPNLPNDIEESVPGSVSILNNENIQAWLANAKAKGFDFAKMLKSDSYQFGATTAFEILSALKADFKWDARFNDLGHTGIWTNSDGTTISGVHILKRKIKVRRIETEGCIAVQIPTTQPDVAMTCIMPKDPAQMEAFKRNLPNILPQILIQLKNCREGDVEVTIPQPVKAEQTVEQQIPMDFFGDKDTILFGRPLGMYEGITLDQIISMPWDADGVKVESMARSRGVVLGCSVEVNLNQPFAAFLCAETDTIIGGRIIEDPTKP